MLMNWNNRKANDPVIVPCNLTGLFLGMNDSCREVFKNMEIMILYSQYIYSLILYTVNNKYLFSTNNEILSIELDITIIYTSQ
jgi:hypothetical protein